MYGALKFVVNTRKFVVGRVLAEGLITKKKFAWCAHSIPFGPQNEHPKGFFDWTTRSVRPKDLKIFVLEKVKV
jgi:hypothetical protein